jgi:putative transposase
LIQVQLKLRPNTKRDALLETWLWHLTGVWNWATRKIGQDAGDGVYHGKFDLFNAVVGHSTRLDIPSHVLQATVKTVWSAWDRYFKKIAGRPHLKGARRPLRSIPFPDPIAPPVGNRIKLLGLGAVRLHKQTIPAGKIKCARLLKRASGWYLALFIDADRPRIKRKSDGAVGIDPGFHDLLTLSTGEKVGHPRELEAGARRLAQAQRGGNKRLTARLGERQANRRKDRNHKLSLDLVERFDAIYFSKDNTKGIARKFGKSVCSSSHSQLRTMLAYKAPHGDAVYQEIDSRFSTSTCSACGSRTGPTGLAGLRVRQWACSPCGRHHDRGVDVAINTFMAGVGRTPEGSLTGSSGIA